MSGAARGGRVGLPSAGAAPSSDRRFRRAAELPVDRRRRTKRGLLRIVRAVLALGVVIAGLVWVGSAVLGSDVLRVRDVRISGNVRLSTAEIEQLVEGLREENLLEVDLEAYQRRLLRSPWIAGASLFRVLPASVQVVVQERTPMAIARMGQQLFLVDDAGVIIDEYDPAYREFDLPIVDGLVADPEAGDATADPDRVALTASLLASLAAAPEVLSRVSQVDVSDPRDARLLFDDDAAWLHLGHERFMERVRRYLELRPTLVDRFEPIDYVDLRFDERIYLLGGKAGRGRKR